MPFVDIHSHILPGFDDGARDDREFLEMVDRALAGGTVRIAATPHCDLEDPLPRLEYIPAEVDRCRGFLRLQGRELDLVPGVEVRVNAGLYRWVKEGGDIERLTLAGNGRYLLADLPLADLPAATADILFLLQLRGLVPILAHPERNRHLASHPERVREMVERGIIIQVNSGSLEGIYGKAARRAAFALLGEGLARLVASDAHDPAGRSPDLSAAHGIIVRRLGEEAARLLLGHNPAAVLAGEDPVALPAAPPRRARRLLPRSR